MEQKNDQVKRRWFVRITIEPNSEPELIGALFVFRCCWPMSIFRPTRRVQAGWRVRGLIRSSEYDDTAWALNDASVDAPASPRPVPPPAQTEPLVNEAAPSGTAKVVVTASNYGGTTTTYPFDAATVDLERIYEARYEILTDFEQRLIKVRVPHWQVEDMEIYRDRIWKAYGRRVSRADIIAEALALFSATHPLPEPESEGRSII